MASLQDIYDEFERFFNEQLPPNLHDLPFRLLESVERIGNELFESLQVYGPPSISLPLPPFFSDATPPPPPPPPPPQSLINRLEKYAHAHPYMLTSYVVGGGITITAVGLGVHYALTSPNSRFSGRAHAMFARRKGGVSDMKDASKHRASSGWAKGIIGNGLRTRRANKWRGKVEDGFLREAILILSPSPLPAILIPLACALIKAGYIVLIAVPHAKEAEDVENKIGAVVEAAAAKRRRADAEITHGTLRVLCYDPEDHSSLAPFQRSLWATLSLRFPAPTSTSLSASQTLPGRAAGDPYAPLPTAQLPKLLSVLSLYALHPSPSPSGTNALPALPTIVRPPTTATSGSRRDAASIEQVAGLPTLVTFVPACGVLQTPETFAEQVITGAQMTLAKNMSIANGSSIRVVFVSVGDIDLPANAAASFEGTISLYDDNKTWRSASVDVPAATTGLGRALETSWRSIKVALFTLVKPFGIGINHAAWPVVEKRVLRIVKAKRSGWWSIGRGSFTPRLLQALVPSTLIPTLLARTDIARLLSIPLPAALPASSADSGGAASTHTNAMPKREQQTTPRPGDTPPLAPSASSARSTRPHSVSSLEGELESDVDSEDVERVSVSTGSRSGDSAAGASRGSGAGLEGSWVGLGSGGEEMSASTQL